MCEERHRVLQELDDFINKLEYELSSARVKNQRLELFEAEIKNFMLINEQILKQEGIDHPEIIQAKIDTYDTVLKLFRKINY